MAVTISIGWVIAILIIGILCSLFLLLDKMNEPEKQIQMFFILFIVSFWKWILATFTLGALFLFLEAFNFINLIN
jgi:hypothetical protein